MELVTLAQAKASRLNRISGVCADSPEFLLLVNDGTRQLMNRGNWWATVVKARFCTYDKCIALPRWVGTVLASNVCGRSMQVQNHWYEFMPISQGEYACGRQFRSALTLQDDGLTPVFQNIRCGQVQYVRAYPRIASDEGKTMTIYGEDYNGQTVRTARPDGTVLEGEVITFPAMPPAGQYWFISTSTQFRNVTRISKDATAGPVDVYQYDATNDVLLDMAHYHPSETEPGYRRMSINGGCHGPGSCGGIQSVEILAKLEYIPIANDTDLVLIQNLDALALAIQSAKLSDAFDSDGAEKMMARAVHELNLQLSNKIPKEQTTVGINPFGTANPGQHGVGRFT